MTEIPDHLLKRAQEAKDKAAAKKAAAGDEASADAPAGGSESSEATAASDDSRIPAHLLARSKSAKAKKSGADAGGDAPAGGTATVTKTADAPVVSAGALPTGAGPGGHTQRLLTTVKSGSIQDVKSKPVDKVHVWPHLLVVEFVAALACTAFVFVFSWLVNAPLLELANFNQTPNPSKAPWYFLGLQELLTMFHPMVAGVTIPGMGIFILILAPYIDKNPSNKPEDRKFAISLMTVHLMFWAVLVIIGSFFRGPGFNFTLPWVDGLFFEL